MAHLQTVPLIRNDFFQLQKIDFLNQPILKVSMTFKSCKSYTIIHYVSFIIDCWIPCMFYCIMRKWKHFFIWHTVGDSTKWRILNYYTVCNIKRFLNEVQTSQYFLSSNIFTNTIIWLLPCTYWLACCEPQRVQMCLIYISCKCASTVTLLDFFTFLNLVWYYSLQQMHHVLCLVTVTVVEIISLRHLLLE